MLNVVWFAWRGIKYAPYVENMAPNGFSTFITPRYVFTDDEGYDYLVKYPDYLQFTGNLSVGMPATDDNLFTDALIVWLSATGDYKYGMLIHEENGEGYQIYIDAQGKALNSTDNAVVEPHRYNIEQLIAKAHNIWKFP